jgi:hypothetical protein
MEFHTEREAALYTMLQRVLHNHVVNYRIGYHQTLAAGMSVLGYVLYVMMETWEEVPALLESTVAVLQQRTRARHGSPPLTPFHDYTVSTTITAPAQELGHALATLLATAGLEHHMSVTATWSVCCPLRLRRQFRDAISLSARHGPV